MFMPTTGAQCSKQEGAHRSVTVQKGVSKTTRVFFQQDNDLETLCKAATVAWEGRSCHRYLEGIYLNLLSLLRRESTVYKAPCPVAGGSTTSLNDFLLDLRRALQQLIKGQSLK
uniref:Interleukin-4 n=1 Tax=Strigops habroptila TaxID=2489341 RepID=A0A672TXL6_STRHB